MNNKQLDNLLKEMKEVFNATTQMYIHKIKSLIENTSNINSGENVKESWYLLGLVFTELYTAFCSLDKDWPLESVPVFIFNGGMGFYFTVIFPILPLS